jgi:hypothetical protein
MTAKCFVDTQRPVTEAEKAAWRFYLGLHRDHWRPARAMFRRACDGDDPSANLFWFISDTGIDDPALLAELEAVLDRLAAEKEAQR